TSMTDMFFFSSRRRHTRFSRDWSSDVCSSDLSRQKTSSLTMSRKHEPPETEAGRASAPYDVTQQVGHLLRKAVQRHTAIFQQNEIGRASCRERACKKRIRHTRNKKHDTKALHI